MDCRVLGPLEIVDGNRPVDLGGDRQRRLLGVLLLRHGTPLSWDTLVDELWGGSPPPSALTSLQVSASRLRKVLGSDAVRTHSAGYSVQVGDDDLDLARFERALAEGRRLRERGRHAAAARVLAAGLQEWRGDLLAGLPRGELVENESTRLSELRLEAREEELAARLDAGEDAELVAPLTALAEQNPFRERVHAALVLALYRSGRQADALATVARLRTLLVDELGVDPSPELAALEGRILRQDPGLLLRRTSQTGSPLPSPATPLVGREREVTEILALTTGDARLVTLTGPGGAGKTRLLLAVGAALAEDPDSPELHLVELAALIDPALVATTVATALGVAQRGERPALDDLVEALSGRPALLLLDNFEQVLPAADDLARLLRDCPLLRLVVTSRERLALNGEHVYPVGPLALPADDQLVSVAEAPAVQLFTARARAAEHDFRLDAANAGVVAELCRRLDGLPLALELAAARIPLLSPEDLLARLQVDPGRVLSGGARDLPERHRALETTIEWSYQLLTPAEQQLMRALSVFRGAATLDAVEQVCGREHDVDDAVRSLLDKSLLVRTAVPGGTVHVSMLQTVRGFAAQRLDGSGEAHDARRRHAEFFSELAAGARVGLYEQHERWLARLDVSIDNLRAALEWSLESRVTAPLAARLLGGLDRYWLYRGTYAEGSHWLSRTLATLEPESPDGPVLQAQLADLELKQGRTEGAVRLLPHVIPRLEQAGDPVVLSGALAVHGDWLDQNGRSAEAVSALTRATEAARRTGLPMLLARSLSMLGNLVLEQGDVERGLGLLDEAAALLPPGATHYVAKVVHNNLGYALVEAHRYAEARDHLVSMVSPWPVPDRDVVADSVIRCNFAWALLGCGDRTGAEEHFARGVELGNRVGDSNTVAMAFLGLGCAAADGGDALSAATAFAVAREQLGSSGMPPDWYESIEWARRAGGLGPSVLEQGAVRARGLAPLEALDLVRGERAAVAQAGQR